MAFKIHNMFKGEVKRVAKTKKQHLFFKKLGFTHKKNA